MTREVKQGQRGEATGQGNRRRKSSKFSLAAFSRKIPHPCLLLLHPYPGKRLRTRRQQRSHHGRRGRFTTPYRVGMSVDLFPYHP